jgi:glycosyltransferase involved in cell wall biosynthesis
MKPRVSVLIATWNRAEFLKTAIESVLSQRFGDFELVIGDNASTDETESLVRGYAGRDPRIRYTINASNVGAVGNWILCHQRANPETDYWVILPSDDWWSPDLLARLVAAGDANPTAGLIHCDAYRTAADGAILNRFSDLWDRPPPAGLHRAIGLLLRGNYFCAPAVLVKREVQERLNPRAEIFDRTYPLTHDYHFYLRMLCRGSDACYEAEPLVYFRKHDGAMTMPANLVPRLQEEVRILSDGLDGVAPTWLEPERQAALQERAARLGFELLRLDQADQAVQPLLTARQALAAPRLDLAVARAISALPVPAGLRGGLWRTTIAAALALRMVRT